jgi:hypothetical protein
MKKQGRKLLTKYSITPERLEGESYEEYKQRRASNSVYLKRYKKGKKIKTQ